MALSEDQRKILEAMQRLPQSGNTREEIVAEVGGHKAVLIGRELNAMQMWKPAPVQATTDDGRGKTVWFLTPCAEDYLRSRLINVQSMTLSASGRHLAVVVDGEGGAEEVLLRPENAKRVEEVFEQNKVDLDRYAIQPSDFPAPVSLPVEVIEPL